MTDVLTALTSLAVQTFRARGQSPTESNELYEHLFFPDPVLKEAYLYASLVIDRNAEFDELVRLIFSEPHLKHLVKRGDELDPMVLYAGGGARVASASLVSGLLSSAMFQVYYLRLPNNEATFVRTVLDGFEELRRAGRGERVRAYTITGISGVTLPEGTQINLPWGTARPAPATRNEVFYYYFGHPKTTCTLAEPKLLTVRFDRAAQPTQSVDPGELGTGASRVLFPLACALASEETEEPVVPLLTWSTTLLPFLGASSYSTPFLVPKLRSDAPIGDRVAEIEDWARVVNSCHTVSVDVAARRLASSVSQRLDSGDALVDAVMVWENLVGTSSEVTFRVTAALTKLLEQEAAKRRAFRKSLAQIYDIRSRLVHGVAVDQSELSEAAKEAIVVAVRALRACYRRGRDWLSLSSTERGDALLLNT